MAIDHDTIVRLLIRDRAKLLGYITAIVREDHAADDVYQEVCILAIRKRDSIESESHLLGWARQAARFTALKVLRARGRRPVLLDGDVLDLIEDDWAELDGVAALEMRDTLAHCMAKLSPRERRLLAMRYQDGLSGHTMATTLNQKTNSIYTAMGRIHRRLGACMRAQMFDQSQTRASGSPVGGER
ncbi:MAG: sigma-70 family RNA polymerase sigma factor [Phycisphaeraceae bacterium]